MHYKEFLGALIAVKVDWLEPFYVEVVLTYFHFKNQQNVKSDTHNSGSDTLITTKGSIYTIYNNKKNKQISVTSFLLII